MFYLHVDTTPVRHCVFFMSRNQWKGSGEAISGTLSSFMSFFHFIGEATVAATPWSYIQGVRYKELGGGSANLSYAGCDYTKRKRDGHFQSIKAQKRHEIEDIIWQIFLKFLFSSQVVKQKFRSSTSANRCNLEVRENHLMCFSSFYCGVLIHDNTAMICLIKWDKDQLPLIIDTERKWK